MTEKRREYMRSWRKKNKEKIRQYKLNAAIRAVIENIKKGAPI